MSFEYKKPPETLLQRILYMYLLRLPQMSKAEREMMVDAITLMQSPPLVYRAPTEPFKVKA